MVTNFERVTNRLVKQNTIVNYLSLTMDGMLYTISCAHENLLFASKFRSVTMQKVLYTIQLFNNLFFQRYLNYLLSSICTLSSIYIFTFEKLIKALHKPSLYRSF
jgi:hypothetical protein